MIDEETERTVEQWVRLGDRLIEGRAPDDREPTCVRCGSRYHVLGEGEQPLCARCYLERGEAAS
ncbi:MAG TPA: hypothetical protein VI814_02885 [Candidatus Limnocylindria bacterium]